MEEMECMQNKQLQLYCSNIWIYPIVSTIVYYKTMLRCYINLCELIG